MPVPSGTGIRGLELDYKEIIVINRTGAATVVGTPYQLDLARTDGDVTNATQGNVNSSLANVIAAANDANQGQICVIGLEVVDDNLPFRVCVQGRCRALFADAVNVGDMATIGTATLAVQGASTKVVAISLESLTGAGIGEVLFDGIHGFACNAAA